MNNRLNLEVQYICDTEGLPREADFLRWLQAALDGQGRDVPVSVVIRIVDELESADLNRNYRNKSGPTNVLSFSYDPPVSPGIQGDLVICAPVVRREAQEQGRDESAHWAHMAVHGMLHLQGHDHADDDDAAVMEAIESRILTKLGFVDPHQ